MYIHAYKLTHKALTNSHSANTQTYTLTATLSNANTQHNVHTQLPENLLNSPHLMSHPEKAFRQASVLTNKQLHRQPKQEVDDSMSGTTAINLLIRNR